MDLSSINLITVDNVRTVLVQRLAAKGITAPMEAELEAELIVYKQELIFEYNRIQDAKDRWHTMKAADAGMPGFHRSFPGIPNAERHFADLLLSGDPLELESFLLTVEGKHNEIETSRKAIAYKLNRQKEYPKIEELVVALWERIVEGRNEDSDTLEIKRKSVKIKHPKPE